MNNKPAHLKYAASSKLPFNLKPHCVYLITITIAVCIYLLIFVSCYDYVGGELMALAVIPVVLTGWYFGLRAGIGAGLLVVPVSTLFNSLIHQGNWQVAGGGSGVGIAATLFIGIVAGWLHNTNQRLKQEIARRKCAEDALRKSAARLAGIVDIAHEAIVSADASGKITLFNHGAEQVFGYTADEAIGDKLDLLIPEQFQQSHRQQVAQFSAAPDISRRMAEREEVYGCRKNGEIFPAEASISKLEIGGQMTLTVVLRDITQRKQTERELHDLSTRLTEANQQLGQLLKRFVPGKVAQQLINTSHTPGPSSDQQREATILFADMRNFTAVAERVGPAHVLNLLNAYLEVIGKAVREHQGSVIQYVGDLVMVTFNVPDDQPDHPLRAARAVLAMRDNLEHFITKQQSGGWPVLRFGFGLHTGTVITGYLGARDRYVYAAVGDATNVAYHICSQAQGGQIIISQATRDLLGEQASTKPLGTFPLKRRRDTYPMYQLEGLVE